MKNTLVLILVLLLGATSVAAQGFSNPIPLPEGLVYGVYDPVGNLTHEDIQLEHQYVAWNQDPSVLVSSINSILVNGRFPLVSLEPRSWNGYEGRGTDETLLDDIIAGKYDDVIETSCNVFAAYQPQQFVVRWGHEMELTGLFPWSQGDPQKYIGAYRHFADKCRQLAGNLKFAWSPAGNGDANDYYPGDEYVDYIGVTVLGYRDWDLQFNETWQSFNQLFWQRYKLVQRHGKPIIISELGVCCGAEHQYHWLKDAYGAMESQEWYPLLKIVVYFNDMNPANAWSLQLTPDWRVCSQIYPKDSLWDTANLGATGFAGCALELTTLGIMPKLD